MCCWFAEALFLCSAANLPVGISTLISFTGRKCMWQIRFQTETYFKCFYLFNWRHFISKDCEFITKSTQPQVQVLCSNCDYIHTQNNHSDALFFPVQSTASSLNHKNNTAHVETACSACWCSCMLLSAPHWTEFTQWKSMPTAGQQEVSTTIPFELICQWVAKRVWKVAKCNDKVNNKEVNWSLHNCPPSTICI